MWLYILVAVLLAVISIFVWLIASAVAVIKDALLEMDKRITALEEGKPYRYKYVHCYLREADR